MSLNFGTIDGTGSISGKVVFVIVSADSDELFLFGMSGV